MTYARDLRGYGRRPPHARWPNGAHESIPNVAAGQLVTIREGAGIVKHDRFK